VLDGLQGTRHQPARFDSGLMHPIFARSLAAVLLWLAGANVLFAQNSPDSIALARSSCAAAGTQFASQTERYSDALKLMNHQTRDNHDAFKTQALQNIPVQADNMEADAINRQVQTWVIEQLWAFAKDKTGQDKLFFKFYILNRCKEKFAVP
jgi:hypothetical protein